MVSLALGGGVDCELVRTGASMQFATSRAARTFTPRSSCFTRALRRSEVCETESWRGVWRISRIRKSLRSCGPSPTTDAKLVSTRVCHRRNLANDWRGSSRSVNRYSTSRSSQKRNAAVPGLPRQARWRERGCTEQHVMDFSRGATGRRLGLREPGPQDPAGDSVPHERVAEGGRRYHTRRSLVPPSCTRRGDGGSLAPHAPEARSLSTRLFPAAWTWHAVSRTVNSWMVGDETGQTRTATGGDRRGSRGSFAGNTEPILPDSVGTWIGRCSCLPMERIRRPPSIHLRPSTIR